MDYLSKETFDRRENLKKSETLKSKPKKLKKDINKENIYGLHPPSLQNSFDETRNPPLSNTIYQ